MANLKWPRGIEWLALGAAAACAASCSSLRVSSGARAVYPLKTTALAEPSLCFLPSPLMNKPPADAGALPAFAEGSAAFLNLRLGDSAPALTAIERQSRDGQTSYRVYVDTDRDRSLADETPCEAREDAKLQPGPLVFTPPLTLPVAYRLASGEVSREYRFRLGFYPVPPDQREQADSFVYCALVLALESRTGHVSVGGKKLRLTLSDGDGDAKLTVGNTPSRDHMRLEGGGLPAAGEASCLTKCVEVGGALYSLEVQPDGSEVAVSRYAGPTAAVCWPVKNGAGSPAELSMLSFAGPSLSISCDSESGRVAPGLRAVPPGSYYLSYAIGRDGTNVFLRAPRPITVESGTTNRFACGGPVSLTCTVRQVRSGTEEMQLRISVSAANEAGHMFVMQGVEHAGTVEVYGPDGKLLGSDNMEYG